MQEVSDSLDELLRRRVQDAAAPPPPHVWPAVESALKKRKRRFFLWLTALGILSLGAAGYLVYQWKTLEQKQQQQKSAPNVQEQPIAVVPAGVSDLRVEQSTAGLPLNAPPNSPPPQQPNSPTAKPPNSPTAQQPNSLTAQPPNSPTTQPPNSPTEPRAASAAIPGEMHNVMTAADILPPARMPLFAEKQQIPAPRKPIQITLPRKKKEPSSCYDFEEHPNVWFADAYAGPAWTNRSLSSPDPEFQNYSRLRRETERTDMAFNAGLRASLLLNRHYLLRTGLHYDQFTEIFEYADPNFIEYTVKVRTELIGGVWQTVTDTIGVDYGEHYQKTYNRYGMLDIPVMLGGEWRRGRTGFSLQAGASLNVFFWNKGKMLSAQGVPVNFDETPPTFRTRTGVSFMGSVQWFWHIQPRLRVFAEPYYRRILRPVTMDAHPVRQQYSLLGIQLGVTKILD